MQSCCLSSPFRVLILTERGNCLFDFNPSALSSALETKDLCKLIASLGHLTELDDFCFLQTALETWVVGRNQVDVDYSPRRSAVDLHNRRKDSGRSTETGAFEALCGLFAELPSTGQARGHGKTGKPSRNSDLVYELHL